MRISEYIRKFTCCFLKIDIIIAAANLGSSITKPALAQTRPAGPSGAIPSTSGINVKSDWYPIDQLNSELPAHVTMLKDLDVGWGGDDYSPWLFLPMKAGTCKATDLVNGNQCTVTMSSGRGGATVSSGAHPIFNLRMGASFLPAVTTGPSGCRAEVFLLPRLPYLGI
jgi:hypothetical protein